jgi:sulfate/thiosulfate transport system permease protein
MTAKLSLRAIAIAYLAAIVLLPVGMVAWRTFEHGLTGPLDALSDPDAISAIWLTLLIAVIAVPLNTVFGILCAIVLVRHDFRGKGVLNAAIDLPLGISPIVVGLSLIIVYGRHGWLGGWLMDNGIQMIFSTPGMVIATIFVSLPFVVREVVPVLREIGTEQEQAATTLGSGAWQTFRLITLPAIRSGVGYGVILTIARSIGEFGAVSVVSGKIIGRTTTMTLYVEESFQGFNLTAAYTLSIVMALLALGTLVAMNLLERKES